MNWDNSDNSDNPGKYTLTDARRLWMVWWNRNAPDLLNLRAKHHAEGQRAFQQLLTESRSELRSDEAVERVALWLVGMLTPFDGWPSNDELGGEPTGDRDMEFKDAWMNEARAAIDALLGEEP